MGRGSCSRIAAIKLAWLFPSNALRPVTIFALPAGADRREDLVRSELTSGGKSHRAFDPSRGLYYSLCKIVVAFLFLKGYP
jgi:hypothetical protein